MPLRILKFNKNFIKTKLFLINFHLLVYSRLERIHIVLLFNLWLSWNIYQLLLLLLYFFTLTTITSTLYYYFRSLFNWSFLLFKGFLNLSSLWSRLRYCPYFFNFFLLINGLLLCSCWLLLLLLRYGLCCLLSD